MWRRTALRANIFGLCVAFSGFYLYGLPSPVYAVSFFSFMFFLLLKVRNPKLNLKAADKNITFLVVTVSIFQLISEGDVSGLFHYNMSFIYYIFINNLIRGLALSDVIRQVKYSSWFLILILFGEAAYRFAHPGGLDVYTKAGNENLLFYAFKVNSFMFEDSNFVALLAMSNFFLLVYLSVRGLLKVKFELVLLFIFIVLTLSRAAILVTVFSLILIHLRSFIYLRRRIFFIFSPLVVCLLLFSYDFVQSLDGSLDSKFLIFGRTFQGIVNSDLRQIFFGNGFGSSLELIGIGAHNFLTIYLLEIGLIGFVIFVFFMVIIIYEEGYGVLYLLFPFLFAGLSLTSVAMPYFFGYLAILVYVERSLIANYKRIPL